MKIARNLVNKPTPIALPGRSVHLANRGAPESEAPISDDEAEEGGVKCLLRTKVIGVREANAADKAAFPTFSDEPNSDLLAVKRRRLQLERAAQRAAGIVV